MSRRVLAVLVMLFSVPAYAANYPILGDWMIVKWVVAPWVDSVADMARYEADAKAHMNMMVSFSPDRVEANDKSLSCTNVEYERTMSPPDALFQGGLPDPNQATIAQQLGLPSGDVPGFDINCSTGLFSFHFADRDSLMFALDNVIYTMDRQDK
jgi:hypothetical protein